MNKHKIVILNGPPNSGKDFVADYFVKKYKWAKLEFKQSLIDQVCYFYGLDEDDFMYDYNNRETKEKVSYEKYFGHSPRGLLIHFSENIYKPERGKDVYGKDVSNKINKHNGNYIISDLGFKEELFPIIKKHHEEYNIYLIRLFSENTCFKSDSRKYMSLNPGETIRSGFSSKILYPNEIASFKKIIDANNSKKDNNILFELEQEIINDTEQLF